MDWETFHTALEEGALAVTANRRLSTALRARFDAVQAARGLSAWPSPEVLPLGAWIGRCWDEALPALASEGSTRPPVPLSSTQALWVWERTGREEKLADALLFPGDTVQRSYEAWRWLQEWRLPVSGDSGDLATPEQALFTRWTRAYTERLEQAGWLDPNQVPERLLPLLEAGTIPLPQRILLAGFDDHPPIRTALWEALARAGTSVDTVVMPAREGEAVRVTLDDVEHEAVAAARWARQRLETDPEVRIGIVVPELTALRPRLTRVFADVLAPGSVLGAGEERGLPFNISQAPALTEAPLVKAALAILGLTGGRLPEALWRSLLLSPYVGGAESEADARAALELRMRRRAAMLSPASVLRLAEDSGEGRGTEIPATPLLARHLAHWRRAFDALPPRALPSEWATHFGALLDAWGWPGERGADSTEYQTREKFEAVGRDFAAMDPYTAPVPLGEARMLFERLLDGEPFQPESGAAPVQVLGVLEAGGLDFDYLWVMGLHHEAWPPAPHPNPFLPLALQRSHGMPHASVTRELELAKRQTARLRTAAPDVVFSHPRLSEERELRPSPLIDDLPEVVPGALPATDTPTLRQVIAAAPAGEPFDDPRGPPLPLGEQPRGGTSVFRDQAACPFRAFAMHRLHARPIEEAGVGPDAADRGTLVHRALHLAWERLRDHATLAALDGAALHALCGEVAAQALEESYAQRPELAGEALRGLERERLTGLLEAWLATERARPPFQVEALETERQCELGSISVTGRVDRIDRLPDGQRILLDYKTGKTSPGSWFGERPDEPQLPIYCASESTPPAGVAFARLRKGELGFAGVARHPEQLPGAQDIAKVLAKQMPELFAGDDPAPDALPAHLVKGWSETLARLGEAFRAGDARVDPKKPPQTCAYCGLESLCRIAEIPGGAVQRDESEQGGENGDG